MSKPIYELEEFKEASGNNILVVDSLNLAFRWKHRGSTDFCDEYLNTVRSLAKSYNANKVIITADWGKSRYREELDPEYKANRKEKYKDQTPEEEQAFLEFFEEYNRTLDRLSEQYPVLKYKGVEADDIAAYITHHYIVPGNYEHIWLVSSDRDWDLLITDKVSRFSYVTRKEYTKENWFEHYEYDLDNLLSIKILMGDKGDNIAGVPGVGPKRGAQLIEQYGSALDVYDALPLPGKQVFIKNLNEFNDKILLNYELIDLVTYCKDAIAHEIPEIEKSLEEYL